MQFKLKEGKILEFLDLNFPQQTFEKGRLLIGQNKRQPLHVYYFGEKFLALLNVNFNTFEYIKVDEVDYNDIKKITLKDGLLFKKMFIETEDFMFNYSTSKALLSDFQNNNFNHFIQNKKERVIFEDGHFI
ncbi:hypothetical protein PYI52_08260 [Staphylococcus epidermidis]|uniref:hypothetical protein n=1 Tax=Staphylococcus epidermidis TaxID=1282 RepID=UPI0011AA61F8|nr:hypothetical protein [Staphylococcus epidermidis]MBM0791107.1 hypothetical protein [Staphylococcus epidermidis]MCG2041779.1 hypothetical protein [Staphylococcus epidermidis]MCG2079581.1 hypothetical protein [Staphylococcus epidermidis]MCG2270862.1 hypothetical protein [Staphylococcus epidermidis]MDH8743585.1 hypothetical protein [Staphylococcus epidermidis]